MTIEGKIALVTGGSRGIGRAICIRLASMGCFVWVNYVSRSDAAEETIELIKQAGGQGKAVQFDVADFDQVQNRFKEIAAESGSIDILVNNAGITRDGLVARMKEGDWNAVLDTNLKGAFSCAKAAVKPMMKNRWGRIVNISSIIGFSGNGGQVNYAAAKSGMIGLTKSLAREFASRKITVNCVAPGYILTEMTDDLDEAVRAKMLSEIPLAALGEADDVAAAVEYLVSDKAGYVTGQTIHVNGGMYM
jgi:3-oxoacyl-[acyl-carrier protein] reductase